MAMAPKGLLTSAGRIGAAAQNALEIARLGGLETDEEPSPFELVSSGEDYRLRRYFPANSAPGDRPPVLLVPPMMLSAEVWDVSPKASVVLRLHEASLDVYVVDFGSPEHEEGGLERTLADHVVAVSEAVAAANDLTGRDVHLAGYSQGGMFAYQAAAYRHSSGIASLITFGAAVDVAQVSPFPVPQWGMDIAAAASQRIFRDRSLPAWLSRNGFKLFDPVKALQNRLDFMMQLHNREALLEREGQRRFMEQEGWVAWPGPALADFMSEFVAQNRMLSGGFPIEGQMVTLADITCPVLAFVGTVDEIAPPTSVRAIQQAAPRADLWEKPIEAGHFGLVVGSKARADSIPTMIEWVQGLEQVGAPPESVERIPEPEAASDGSATTQVKYGAELLADVGKGIARDVAGTVGKAGRSVLSLADDALWLLPRLARLERVRKDTPISLGLLLDEKAESNPNDTFFLFEGRGHTYADAKRRIDNIVRGLIHVGVRQGDHVGLLMDTRPSAIAVIAALSRLGAITVLMRPDGDYAVEAGLGEVSRVITDPEHGAALTEALDVPVMVLGGGGEPRELGFGLLDMERIDPDEVRVPSWYSPNPGRAEDLAFILFTGRGAETHASRITNRRWSLSAYGTASSAALTANDTVYSVTPIHHASGLLVAVGGAVAGGARLALASEFKPETFWREVRRYGATIVSYTWTLCRELVDADPDPAEQHHPVRLFIGSGMPTNLWRRVIERFAPARVLEFYASTEGTAVLANVSSSKIGAKGRPIPGSAEVALVRYDVATGRPLIGPDGYAITCGVDVPGLLLAKVDRERGALPGSPLRSVFRRGDAWQSTGDIFRRDGQGDYWLLDHANRLILKEDGPVASVPIEDHLGELESVDLAVVYGVRGKSKKATHDVAVAAVTARPGRTIDPGTIAAHMELAEPAQRPDIVLLVDEIPLTTWYRPKKSALIAEGVPKKNDPRVLWRAS
ncbi:MAG: alpha/beta fold hydrolase [Nitriliruptorales bacterium]|nr:alpha/beta fold hydrolase [Nitriliruptorales bacterium]